MCHRYKLIDFIVSAPSKKVFSSLWKSMGELIKAKNILAPVQVFREIEQGNDDLIKWCKENREIFLPNTPVVVKFAREIIEKYPSLVNPYASRETADPFIMALARSLKSNITDSKPMLVTEENNEKENRIPYVSKTYGLESMKLTGMLQSEKWEF